MPHIRLNGEPKELPEGTTVADLVTGLGLSSRPVAVERNRHVVSRDDHGDVTLEEGDQIEIVSFVPGG